MKKGMLILTALFLLVFAQQAHAAQETVWDMANSDQYGKKAAGMLGRGLVNVATCFVDVIVQTVNGTQDGPPFVGSLTGLGGGIACTALRVTSGALDVVTFWVPDFNGIPVSRSYSNCLEVEEAGAPAEQAAPVYEAPQAPVIQPEPVQAKSNALNYIKK